MTDAAFFAFMKGEGHLRRTGFVQELGSYGFIELHLGTQQRAKRKTTGVERL